MHCAPASLRREQTLITPHHGRPGRCAPGPPSGALLLLCRVRQKPLAALVDGGVRVSELPPQLRVHEFAEPGPPLHVELLHERLAVQQQLHLPCAIQPHGLHHALQLQAQRRAPLGVCLPQPARLVRRLLEVEGAALQQEAPYARDVHRRRQWQRQPPVLLQLLHQPARQHTQVRRVPALARLSAACRRCRLVVTDIPPFAEHLQLRRQAGELRGGVVQGKH
eukprot:1181563-Prorocentrum_minimum.AAC.3